MPKIIEHPDDRLRTVCKPVKKIDKKTKEDAETLMHALLEMDSPFKIVNGIASNQVGIMSRIVVLKTPLHRYVTMINPEIVGNYLPSPSIEFCASLPGKMKMKKRGMVTKIRYLDLENTTRTMTLFGSASFIMQQELDHLDGRLIID